MVLEPVLDAALDFLLARGNVVAGGQRGGAPVEMDGEDAVTAVGRGGVLRLGTEFAGGELTPVAGLDEVAWRRVVGCAIVVGRGGG